MKPSIWIAIGSLAGLLSVAFGAFGAHALAETLDEKALSIFRTGAQYQMYHALALVLYGVWATQSPGLANSRLGLACGLAFTLGIFSGSLYALALSGVKVLGAVTPLGGLSFMVGWIAFAILALRAGKAV